MVPLSLLVIPVEDPQTFPQVRPILGGSKLIPPNAKVWLPRQAVSGSALEFVSTSLAKFRSLCVNKTALYIWNHYCFYIDLLSRVNIQVLYTHHTLCFQASWTSKLFWGHVTMRRSSCFIYTTWRQLCWRWWGWRRWWWWRHLRHGQFDETHVQLWDKVKPLQKLEVCLCVYI